LTIDLTEDEMRLIHALTKSCSLDPLGESERKQRAFALNWKVFMVMMADEPPARAR
jgi:hypothetical protein